MSRVRFIWASGGRGKVILMGSLLGMCIIGFALTVVLLRQPSAIQTASQPGAQPALPPAATTAPLRPSAIPVLGSEGEAISRAIATEGFATIQVMMTELFAPTSTRNPNHTLTPPTSTATPRPSPAHAQPITGRGAAKIPINLNPGAATFKVKHTGQGAFIVEVLNERGQLIELLAHTTGNYDKSMETGIIMPGPHVLNIQADGDWSIELSQ